MANFAVMSGDTVVNCIVADNLETAMALTNSTCVEYTDENPGGIGMLYVDGQFIVKPEPEVIDEDQV